MPYSCHLESNAPCDRDPHHLFSFAFEDTATSTHGQLQTDLKSLEKNTFEVWRSTNEHTISGTAHIGSHVFPWRSNQDVLFIWHQQSQLVSDQIIPLTEQLYDQILNTTKQLGFDHIVRAWNYFGDINDGSGDHERYRLFCLGRQKAFQTHALQKHQFPAASALGHHKDSFSLVLMCAKRPAEHVENKQQVSAYNYPRQYGPSAPSFARAGRLTWPKQRDLFISGTAAIRGHESLHDENTAAQAQLALDNIELLLNDAQDTATDKFSIRVLRVYLKHPDELAQVKTVLAQRGYGKTPTVFLWADVCRRELTVEMEAFAQQIHV